MSRDDLLRALVACRWNTINAAMELNCSREYVYVLMRRYGLREIRPCIVCGNPVGAGGGTKLCGDACRAYQNRKGYRKP